VRTHSVFILSNRVLVRFGSYVNSQLALTPYSFKLISVSLADRLRELARLDFCLYSSVLTSQNYIYKLRYRINHGHSKIVYIQK